ncbi:flagellar hook-associated protein FlgK [Succinimonas amylolytica]|uniref:flagellar hook-associated protein FlgK n=1 Tax=Succinimonas amylolytica TaxID=83769 RepID=UPI000365A699|nr:flagellar hook-associated protein FlgK [Succinimonas amylolytica]
MSDMLKIGTSGVLAQRALLQTTSNNISNVNTEGYSRQRSIIRTNVLDQGTGVITTSRVINTYAERELLRDNARVGYYTAKTEGLSSIDSMLSSDATGLNPVISDLFASIQGANSAPTELSARNSLMGNLEVFTNRVNSIGNNIQEQYITNNRKILESVNRVNDLLESIYKFNSQIVESSTDTSSAAYLQMQDQRDHLIEELSEIIDIKTVDQPNGSCYVNMASGPTLVLGDGCATLAALPSSLDESEYQLGFTYNASRSYTMLSDDVGGKLGGYFDAGDSLREVQRSLGKLTVALADSLNKQNKSGITLENNAGDALFNFPETRVFTKSTTAGMTMSFMEGYAGNVTGKDYLIKINEDGTYALNEKNGNTLTEIFQGNTADLNGTITIPGLGFQLEVAGTPSVGDEFLIQPTANVSYNLSMKINRPEDFAFASVVRASENSQNLGNATISINGVTNTDATSAFSMEPSRSISGANFAATAPVKVVINATGDYEVYDTNDNLLGTTLASTKGGNILANMLSDVSDPDSRVYADPDMTPGYDFSITGTVRNGDSFSIELNTNGFADNSNGIMMQDLEQAQLVQGKINQTVSASYSDMVSNLGSTIAVSNVNLEAATAKRDQTLTITEESSGVDLNEEASNLVRYQQCYQASARIIAASQTVFESLMSALG